MGENDLVAEVREATGKGAARKLRAAGRIPAVLYGKGRESRSLTLDPAELRLGIVEKPNTTTANWLRFTSIGLAD